MTAVRDQIVIGKDNSKVREEVLKFSWDLATLRREGMKIESAVRGGGGRRDNRRTPKPAWKIFLFTHEEKLKRKGRNRQENNKLL